MNYWEGDNGGATSKGVTRDEIRIGWACGFYCPADERTAEVQAVIDHFNRRYEFYGRKLRLFFTTVGTQTQNEDPTVQRAAAERVANEFDVFAALDPGEVTNDASAYFDTLVQNKVIALTDGAAMLTDEDVRRRAPFQWTYVPTADQLGRTTAALACAHLKDRPPRYTEAGPLEARRRFAIVRKKPSGNEGKPLSTEALQRGLEACNAPLYPTADLSLDSDQEAVRQAAFADMRANGVTTVACVCTRVTLSLLMVSAGNAGFRPEWLMPGVPGSLAEGMTNYQLNAPPDQRVHMFGVWSDNRLSARGEEPWWAAVREAGPDAPTSDSYRTQARAYHQLLMLASGIQAAGPNLAPETLRSGLQKLRFSNPGGGGPPFYQATVGFGPGDYTMVNDLALHWWDDTADSLGRTQNPRGAFCFVDLGARFPLERPPAVEPVFFDRTKPCR